MTMRAANTSSGRVFHTALRLAGRPDYMIFSNRTGKPQIFKQRFGQDTAEPLTQPVDVPGCFTSSPDGNWFVFRPSIRGSLRLMRLAVSGGSREQAFDIPFAHGWGWNCSIKPGGICVVMLVHPEQQYAVFKEFDALRGLGKDLGRIEWTPGVNFRLSVSPDGRVIAVSGQKEQIRILDWPNGKDRIVRLPAGWLIYDLSFTADGKALLADTWSQSYFLARIELDAGRAPSILRDRGRDHYILNPQPSPNNQYVSWSEQIPERSGIAEQSLCGIPPCLRQI